MRPRRICFGPTHRRLKAKFVRARGCIDFSVEAFGLTRVGVYDRGGWGRCEGLFHVFAPLATMAHVEPRLSRPYAATVPRPRSSHLEQMVVACLRILLSERALRIGRLDAVRSGCSFGCWHGKVFGRTQENPVEPSLVAVSCVVLRLWAVGSVLRSPTSFVLAEAVSPVHRSRSVLLWKRHR